jgi:uncharacterized protein YciI
MARWVAIFDDADATADIRRAQTDAHLAYLDAHADEILIGGGLRPGPDEWYCGGLWIMDVADRARAVRLCEDDPFFKAGLELRAALSGMSLSEYILNEAYRASERPSLDEMRARLQSRVPAKPTKLRRSPAHIIRIARGPL